MVVAEALLGSNLVVSAVVGCGLWQSRKRVRVLEQSLARGRPPYLGSYDGPFGPSDLPATQLLSGLGELPGVGELPGTPPVPEGEPAGGGGSGVIVPLRRPLSVPGTTATRSRLAHPSRTEASFTDA